ncbi:hypothetical protein HanRHA438_Chr10g0468511 [Helianthus annuus]|nr:hypothetical protein HanIR_Chr10g0491141 [Helianthus annuus]KAJ0880912.1 hypothetical protein HanRHA438_Chr10g0468511 [Helianthus annuus]
MDLLFMERFSQQIRANQWFEGATGPRKFLPRCKTTSLMPHQ